MYGYVLVVGFPGASVKALSVNICTGVHISVTTGFPGEDHVIVGCALRIGFFIQGLSGFTFSGEIMIDVNNA